MEKILALAEEGDDSAVEIEELVFEQVIDDERSIIRVEERQDLYERLEESDVQEVRLKEDLHSLLVSAVCQLKERI